MSELSEQTWAVLSERGVEARDVVYADAAAIVGRLMAEDVRGFRIVTAKVAARFTDAERNPARRKQTQRQDAI